MKQLYFLSYLMGVLSFAQHPNDGSYIESSQIANTNLETQYDVRVNTNLFLREPEDDPHEGRSWFKLAGVSGATSILVGFLDGASDAYDANYDGEFVNEGSPIEFYSFIDTDKYVIQGCSELVADIDRQVNLGFEVIAAGTYTISIMEEYINTDFNIILDDTYENIQTDLRINNYTFDLHSPIETNDRFVMRYNYDEPLSVPTNAQNSISLKAYFDENVLVSVVDNAVTPNMLDIFNVIGKRIMSSVYHKHLDLNGLPSGLYLVKYHFSDGASIVKRVLKK